MHRSETLVHIIGDRPTLVTVRSEFSLRIQNNIHTFLGRET